MRIVLVLTALVASAMPAISSAATPAREKTRIRTAFTEFRSGLRHEDGKLACSRMTLRYRRDILAAVAEEGVAGIGCETLIEMAGRELYNDLHSRRLVSVVVDGTRARAYTDYNSSTVCFKRDRGRWKLSDGRPYRVSRCPHAG